MKLFFHVLASLALVKGNAFGNDEELDFCKIAGGPHGDPFDDTEFLEAGQALMAIKLCSGHRVDGIGVSVMSKSKSQLEPFHGSEKNCATYNLAPDEHIISIEVHTTKKRGKTRVGFVKFTNQNGQVYEAGRKSDDEDKISGCSAPDGYHLGGFYGREGDEIDAIAAIWVPIDPLDGSGSLSPPSTQFPIVGPSSQFQEDDSSDDFK